MANQNNKAALKRAFNAGTLSENRLGWYYETVVNYRGYYVDGAGGVRWAGPWRNDNTAAAMDAFPYAKRGFNVGVRMRQS